MTQDDILAIANDMAFMGSIWIEDDSDEFKDMIKFAQLVAAKEREACAKVCDDIRHPWGYSSETSDWSRGTEHCADAIRARGEA